MQKLLFLLIVPIFLWSQNYHGAEYRTLESFLYGRFETRLKPAAGDGFVSSFFTYNDDNPTTEWTEIDFEILGRWNDNIDLNVIDETGSHLRQNPVFQNVNLDFHTYAFEWTPDYVAWFFDEIEIYRQTGEHINDLNEPSKIMMNIWTPVFTDWVGEIDPRILPRYSHYDWVSYAAYTPGTGSIGTDMQFSPQWLDDFDSYDTTRWEKSIDHIWNGNQSLLIEDNAVFEDGHLILCLTDAGQTNVSDQQPPFGIWGTIQNPNSIMVRLSEEVDSVTASNTDTYHISGIQIIAAELWGDQRTVSLTVSDLDFANDYRLIILGLLDDSVPPNIQTGQVLNLNLPPSIELPLRINCGGPAMQGYQADQWWSAEVAYGHEGGNYQLDQAFPDITGTDMDSVYAYSLNRFSRYNVRLAPGQFDLTLSFVELGYPDPGDRIFELYVEDSLINGAIDVNAAVGPQQLYQITLTDVPITDGELNLLFSASIYGRGYAYSGPFLNAIQIEGEYAVAIGDERIETPEAFGLSQAFPNPFNTSTTFQYQLIESALTELRVYDLQGRYTTTLFSELKSAGKHTFSWNADTLDSGIYILQLRSGSETASQKVLMIK